MKAIVLVCLFIVGYVAGFYVSTAALKKDKP